MACRREVVTHRQNCGVCHAPLNADGGIEEAHPWLALSCVDCHGGQDWVCNGTKGTGPGGEPTCSGAWVYEKERAHVSPGTGPRFVKNLSTEQLDALDPAYLRFVNPGDLRVVDQTCGRCHAEAVKKVLRSTMAHTAGEVAVARYRAGVQPTGRGLVGGQAVVDPAPDPAATCEVSKLDLYVPPSLQLGSTDPARRVDVGNAQDQYMVKSCFRCHLFSFGENRFRADYRSSGCTACHMVYDDDGHSRSGDPRISKDTVPHPRTHQLTTAPDSQQCMHCHYRGGRIGPSFFGYRESSGKGLNPPRPAVLNVAQHGHDSAYYLTDEDTTNDVDETPPDLHRAAGMDCVDCHTGADVHGNGHITADTQCAVVSECTDCHGTVRAYATPNLALRNNFFERDGGFFLKTRLSGLELAVPQTKDTVTPGAPGYTLAAAESMGVNANGFSHADTLECYTCHAGWAPSCYGCHVDIDLTRQAPYHTTGALTDGYPAGNRRWIQHNDLVLMRDVDGLLAPSMPAERFFMNVLIKDEGASADAGRLVKKKLIEAEPRTFRFPGGRTIAGFGQRAFNPHTTVRKSQFMACDRCHPVADADAAPNQALLDITWGFGSQRFPQPGCDVSNADPSCDKATDWTTYQLDAIQTRAGEPLVAVGHDDPQVSRPLTLSEIARMKRVVLPASRAQTPVPPDAGTDPGWPAYQQP
jgi:hypothetical protein